MRRAALNLLLFVTLILGGCTGHGSGRGVLYSSPQFTLFTDSLVEGNTIVRAASPWEMSSNYTVPYRPISSLIRFRLSVNERDNELPEGCWHYMLLNDSVSVSEAVPFGRSDNIPASAIMSDTLPRNYIWRLRVDMRGPLRDIGRKGYFTTPAGDTIYSGSFNSLWVTLPLRGSSPVRLRNAGDSVFEAVIPLSPAPEVTRQLVWHKDSLPGGYPSVRSSSQLTDAVVNMSLCDIAEMIKTEDVETEPACMAVILALAVVDPEGSMEVLRSMVEDGEVRRQPGIGGGWPVVNSEVIWGAAAWAVFEVTGDRAWLGEAFDVLVSTLERNYAAAFVSRESLICGTVQNYTSTYPQWMDASGIYGSYSLLNNIYYIRAFDVLADMGALSGRDASLWRKRAAALREAVNFRFWLPSEGFYSRMIYGSPYGVMMQGTDNVAQALASLWHISVPEMSVSIMDHAPLTPYGPATVTPQVSETACYPFNSVSPETNLLWYLMACRAGNMAMAGYTAAAQLRMAALAVSNRGVCDASSGVIDITADNPMRRLTGAAANVALVLKGYAGMKFGPEGMEFSPCRPFANDENLCIEGIRYRNADLTVNITGSGRHVAAFSIDGVPSGRHLFPAGLGGRHTVDITLTHTPGERRQMTRFSPVSLMLPTPQLSATGDSYRVSGAGKLTDGDILTFVDGSLYDEHTLEEFSLSPPIGLRAVTVSASNRAGAVSYAAQPVLSWGRGSEIVIAADSLAVPGTKLIEDEKTASAFVETTGSRRKRMRFSVMARAGRYVLSVLYANGYGPVSDGSMCAVRSLYVNGARAGLVVMPALGPGEWRRTSWSSPVWIDLHEGDNMLSVEYDDPLCRNADGRLNTALIRCIRIVRSNSY